MSDYPLNRLHNLVRKIIDVCLDDTVSIAEASYALAIAQQELVEQGFTLQRLDERVKRHEERATKRQALRDSEQKESEKPTSAVSADESTQPP